MKWPFVRTSFHDNIVSQLIDREIRLGEENNRLNQELANELNSHRETREYFQYTIDGLRIHNNNIEKELQETKDALKIAQEDLKNAALCINEQNTQLEIWKKRSNFYMGKCSIAKEEILKTRGYLKKIAKKL